MRRTLLILAVTVGALALPAVPQEAGQRQERDLRLEKDDPQPEPATAKQPVTIPHSYALVVGIGDYKIVP